MKFIVKACLILTFLNACTKNSESQKAKQNSFINYKSAIQYEFKETQDPDQAAMVEETPVSWSQLLSNDVALQELQTTYDHKGLVYAYAWALSLGDENGELNVHIADPEKELKTLLAGTGVEPSKSITVTYSNPTDQVTLATMGEKKLTWKDFQSSSIQNSRLYDRVFQQRMQRLNGVVVRRFLLQASKDANIGMEDFVKDKILQGEFNPTEQDVRDFAKQKGIAETDIDEVMLERLKEIVKQNHRDKKIEEYVAKNLIKKPIQVAFDSPKIQVKTPEISEAMPHWGAEQGPELVFVGHWDCENCGDTLKSFLQTKDDYSKVMQGAFIYSFPESNREARMGAEAALCVKDQSPDAFWTFLGKVMTIESDNAEEKINMAAKDTGVNYDEFRDCFLKREQQQVVDTHLAYANNLGITSAPLMILQGNVLELPLDNKTLTAKIKELGLVADKKKNGLIAKIKAFFGF